MNKHNENFNESEKIVNNVNPPMEFYDENTVNDYVMLEQRVSIENEITRQRFEYLSLDPRSEIIPSYDLGIEITVPKLASNKPNIDPQHGSTPNLETSAIEEATEYNIDTLPQKATIGILRPDADALGAVSVLELRLGEICYDTELVKAIGRVDALGYKRAIEEHPEISPRQKEITAASQICLGKTPLAKKILFMKKLLTNRVDWSEIENINNDWKKQKEIAKKKLIVEPLIEGSAVMVTGDHPQAFAVGYEEAGIVAAYNPNFKRPWIENDPTTEKWTIARYSEKEPINITELKDTLNALEQNLEGTGKWGGPANLVASPQGETSKIPKSVILETIKSCISNPENINNNYDENNKFIANDDIYTINKQNRHNNQEAAKNIMPMDGKFTREYARIRYERENNKYKLSQ